MSAPPPSLSRAARLGLACFAASALVGLVATLAVWTSAASGRRLSAAVVAAAVPVGLATIANLGVRWVRWQYLLRRMGLRAQTIPSLGGFVASFALLPVPLYAGQLIARLRLGAIAPAAGTPIVVRAFVVERLLDAWALALLALPACGAGGAALLAAAAALTAVPPVRRALVDAVDRLARAGARMAVDEASGRALEAPAADASPGALAVAAALSVAAWLPPAAALLVAARAAGLAPAPLATVATAAWATLVGGVSGVPLGAGVAGVAALHGLVALGAPSAAAAPAVFVWRVATTWLTVAHGVLAVALLRRRGPAHAHAHDHFDAIDACYDAWLPLHYRRHLVTKKTTPMIARLAALGARPHGLDIGCGRGWYLEELIAAGARMTGIDLSTRQLVAAQATLDGRVPLARASALALPFRARAFDFAYIVNVLHHVATPPEQAAALAEIGRVVRPGGLVFVHEMNVANPLFRLYLGYVFPVLKGIEEGTEYYLDPRRLPEPAGLRLVHVEYFTFIPDFAPAGAMRVLDAVERRLERGPLRRLAAHFVAVYERAA